MTTTILRDALRKAYNFGQQYWQQADSDSLDWQKKSAETSRKFAAFVDDTSAALAAADADQAPDAAPWPDFLGQAIHHGDRLLHPQDGAEFVAVRLNGHSDAGDAWRAVYDNGTVSRLCLQIGDKGQAVLSSAARPAPVGAVPAPADIKAACYRVDWTSNEPAGAMLMAAMKEEIVDLRAALGQQAGAVDGERLRFAMQDIDGFGGVTADKYDYATRVATEAGRDEPSKQDELDGIRMLIDAAMASANKPTEDGPGQDEASREGGES